LEAAIRIERLSYRYPDGLLALNEISLEIPPSQKVALVGPNGAGKSTLLLHLNGVLTGQGRVSICGLEVSRPNLKRIRTLVGLVFQSPDDQLFSSTVYEDVAYGPVYQGLPAAEVADRVAQALAAVNMEAYRQRVPYHLSIGEKKRIAIATVLSMQPSILALDEPTSGLDPRARRELIQLLQQLPQTVVVSTHDLDFVRKFAARTVIIDQGRIIADGETGAILEKRQLLHQHGLD
jgi:cobalt/nickel transport system ATP-binding protein